LEKFEDGGEVVIFADHQSPHWFGVQVGPGQGEQGDGEIAVGYVEGFQEVFREAFLADAVCVIGKRGYFCFVLPEF
jgi:hypothetical protein